MKKDYTYAVARIRSRELSLLSRKDIDNLLGARSYEECIQYLSDKGFGGDDSNQDASEMLSAEREKIWSLMAELTDDLSPFDVFRFNDDFHNLKVSVKAVTRDVNPTGMFMKNGTMDGEKIYEAIKAHSYSVLPQHLRQPAQEAMTALLQTGDGQLCDIIIDRACLEAMRSKAKESGSDVIELYAELTAASADIKTAVRCEKTGKSLDFILRALAPCDTLNVDMLAKAASKSLDDIYGYLSGTSYATAVDALKISPTEFEKWCDNKLIDSIKPQKSEPFKIGPLAAYIIARENEIKAVRLILSAKLNDLNSAAINERLRDMYV